jgi:hypothetical protein
MTKNQLKSLAVFYIEMFESHCEPSDSKQMAECDMLEFASQIPSDIRHSHYKFMCNALQTFADEGRMEKAMMWLGFIQGVCWRSDLFTLDDLKKQALGDMVVDTNKDEA